MLLGFHLECTDISIIKIRVTKNVSGNFALERILIRTVSDLQA